MGSAAIGVLTGRRRTLLLQANNCARWAKLLETTTAIIKKWALELGFDQCRIARAGRLDEDAVKLANWLNNGLHGTMKYMENHFELRVDPCKLVPGAKSVITMLLNYFPAQEQNADSPRISKYAYGRDYHEVIREKLNH